MSYNVYILRAPYAEAPKNCSYEQAYNHFKRQIVNFPQPHFLRGGTYVVVGTNEAYLNITYNYAHYFARFLGGNGLRDFEGKSVAETLPKLMTAVMRMPGEPDEDYWAPTEGNARHALAQLITLALMSPEATKGYWHVD